MSFGEFNGGDEATIGKLIIFLTLITTFFILFWLLGPESSEIVEMPLED